MGMGWQQGRMGLFTHLQESLAEINLDSFVSNDDWMGRSVRAVPCSKGKDSLLGTHSVQVQ